jgi:hypothetical protein
MRHFLLLISFFLSSCSSSFNEKQALGKDNIQFIEIRKQFDTVSLRLTDDQAANFIESWNNASPQGPSKYLPQYLLTIHFKGDSSLSFSASGQLIKQTSDWAYSVGDKAYFQKLWFKQAGLADNYVEYLPTYNKDGKFSKDSNPLDEKHASSIKQVLAYYNHKWMDIRGQVFYEGKIDDGLLWNYTMKANDSIWLSSHSP